MSSWTLDPASVRRLPQGSAGSAHRQGIGTDLSDDVAQARSQRLLSDAKAALWFATPLRDSRALQHNAVHRSHFNPNQSRVPMGNPDGGQWTSMGAANDPRVISDAKPDNDWRPGAQYAQVDPRSGRPPRIPERRPSSRSGRARVLREHGEQIIEAASWFDEFYPSIRSYFDPPKTLQELQEAVATPKKGYDIHHIVEQTSAEQDGFPRSVIDAHINLVRIPRMKHWEINGWYARPNKDYGGRSPREYLRGKDWSERLRVGLDALVKYGVLKP
jgi:hypothetical protein